MVNGGARAVGIHREGAARVQVLGPVDSAYASVEGIGVHRLELRQRQQYSVGDARPQTDSIGILEGAGKMGASAGLGHLVQPQSAQFLRQQGF